MSTITNNANKCSIPSCNRESYIGRDKCILHCEKDESLGFVNSFQFSDFYNTLIDEVVEYAFKYIEESGYIRRESFKGYLKNQNQLADLAEFSKKVKIQFTLIVFPKRDEKYPFDYLQVLKKLGEIHFDNCKFTAFGLDIKGAKCFFQECDFLENWLIHDLQVSENFNNVLYQQCTFEQDVNECSETEERFTINIPLFHSCKFLGNVNFEGVDFKKPLFNDDEHAQGTLKQLELTNCTFSDRFILNNYNVEDFSVSDTVFSSKFEFKTNTVADFLVVNTNFSEIADFYGSKFELFLMERNIFKDFVGFEDCRFGIKDASDFACVATFKYVTFLSFANFRNTSFYGGLDIEFINLKEPPNFLNSLVCPTYTNRETFRIIKHSFDKIGNNIEANKFFVLEMKKYKEELAESKEITQEKVVFILNEMISDFGQSYLRPMSLLVGLGCVYTALVIGCEKNVLYRIFVPANNLLSGVSDCFNGFAMNILPFSKFLKPGMEFISLIFYVVFAALIWQTVIAVKRHVRR